MARSRARQVPDWISLVERAYTLDDADQDWLGGLLNCLPRGLWGDGLAAYTFDARGPSLIVHDVAVARSAAQPTSAA